MIKKNSAAEAKKVLDMKKKIEASKAKKDEYSIHDGIKDAI